MSDLDAMLATYLSGKDVVALDSDREIPCSLSGGVLAISIRRGCEGELYDLFCKVNEELGETSIDLPKPNFDAENNSNHYEISATPEQQNVMREVLAKRLGQIAESVAARKPERESFGEFLHDRYPDGKTRQP